MENKFYKIFGDISSVKQDWTPNSFVDMTLKDIKSRVGHDKVILGLSGGVDSSVAAIYFIKLSEIN